MTNKTLTLTVDVPDEDEDNQQIIYALDELKKDIERGCTSGILGMSSDSWEISTDE